MRTFDPEIYLTNGTREVLGLTGQSTQPLSIVQAAQEGCFAATGRWIYVDGTPNTAPAPAVAPAPAPAVAPAPAAAKPGIDLSGASDLMKLSLKALKDFAATNAIDISGLPRDKQLLAEYIAANMNLKDHA